MPLVVFPKEVISLTNRVKNHIFRKKLFTIRKIVWFIGIWILVFEKILRSLNSNANEIPNVVPKYYRSYSNSTIFSAEKNLL